MYRSPTGPFHRWPRLQSLPYVIAVFSAPCLLVVGAPLASVAKKASFTVNAQLTSGWPQTPSAAQSLEWLRDVDATAAKSFVWQLIKGGSVSEAVSPLAAQHLQSGSAKTFHELLVRNSYYSPRIEMLRSLERVDRRVHGTVCSKSGAGAWALLWNADATAPAAVCDASALKAALAVAVRSVANPEGFVPSTLDLILRDGSPGGIAVIYGALDAGGLASLSPLLEQVHSLGSSSSWTVLFRHADSPKGLKDVGADLLTGYGFELAIKSSEYKTHADEKDKKSEDDAAADGSEPEDTESESTEVEVEQKVVKELDGPLEIDGLLFHVLLNRSAELRPKIWDFKEQLESERDTDAVLKAWEIKEIGLQAAAKIQASPTPLVAMTRLSQNFPAQVAGLARMPVSDKLRKQFRQLRRVVREGAEVFSVNNRMVRADHSDLSLFPIMKTLQPFFIGVERLVRVGIPETVACEILKETRASKQPERIDWRSPQLPPPLYHVSKDRKSSRWPPNLMSLLYAFPGGLVPVRAALYTMVLAFDPMELSELHLVNKLISEMPMPVAIHLVMVPGATVAAASGSWDEDLLGKKPSWVNDNATVNTGTGAVSSRVGPLIAALYGYFLGIKPSRARVFLKRLGEQAEHSVYPWDEQRWPDTDETVENLKAIFTNMLSSEEKPKVDELWESVVLGKAENSDHAKIASQYVYNLGVPIPSMLFNGKLLLKAAFDSVQTLFTNIAMEQQFLQQTLSQNAGVAEGRSPDEAAVELLATAGFLQAYHTDITPEVAQRGGEEGVRGDSANAIYLLWPNEAFTALPFLTSSSPTEKPLSNRLAMYHVTVLRRLSHSYLLQSFAGHLLAQGSEDNSTHDSYWSVLVDSGTDKDGALADLQACVRGVLQLDGSALDADDVGALERKKLQLLKFLGAAVPAAMGGDTTLGQGRVMELCELGVQKKLDPAFHVKAMDAVKAAKGYALQGEAAMFEAANAARDVPRDAALWGCNGRQIALKEGGQPVFPRHIATLEKMELQYDNKDAKSEDESQEGEEQMNTNKESEVTTLTDWLVNITSLPSKAQGLVAAIRSEALSHGKMERFTPSGDIMDHVPPTFKLHLPPPRPDAASPIKVFGLLDPLSSSAQSASAVLALFGMAFNAEVTLILNPLTRHSEYPLKRYYREVIRWPDTLADGSASADLEGGEVANGHAEFHLATRHTLTAAVHALPTWLVTSSEARHDMDNLRLVDVGDGKSCDVTYVLRQLYVEGQAFVLSNDGWPIGSAKGLQIEARAKGNKEVTSDTSVMGNVGYFQVRGNPGLYQVSLKAGLSNDTFAAVNMKDLEVSSYITPPYQVRVKTRDNRSHEDLFDKSAATGGKSSKRKKGALSRLLGGFAGMFGGEEEEEATPDNEEDYGATPTEDADTVTSVSSAAATAEAELPTIHIFSVASGHLYEKLLGIMIQSVRNNTKCPLHFWFIDQFLSPTFKAFIPKMAERFHFDFDFVTYKWPSWLNPQTEKQRLIWAYKILFLDVLFPLDVPKIIFIDADQVVRADVKELWDMDLQGNVYGFTPMGDSNLATEGFRFWKQGYWKNHLRGKPYHISALFVVDLEEFRRTSTGDALRGVYNQLSQDPNSLANLDQDLPNFAQHQIGIFSLPQDWLWCETWCSQESKATAKTIDLCQNPLTKEPKIVMAARIISEWQAYHDEVARFQEAVMNADAAAAAPAALPAAGGTAAPEAKPEL